MQSYHICVIGGWCGNRLIIVAEHLAQLLQEAGYPCRVTHHSVWENYTQPPFADLILQLLPAFTEAEAGCPVINIRPLIGDLNHPETTDRILQQVRADHLLGHADLLPQVQV